MKEVHEQHEPNSIKFVIFRLMSCFVISSLLLIPLFLLFPLSIFFHSRRPIFRFSSWFCLLWLFAACVDVFSCAECCSSINRFFELTLTIWSLPHVSSLLLRASIPSHPPLHLPPQRFESGSEWRPDATWKMLRIDRVLFFSLRVPISIYHPKQQSPYFPATPILRNHRKPTE